MMRIADLCELVRDGIEPVHLGEEEIRYYSIPALDSGGPANEIAQSIVSRKWLVREGDILVSRINPRIPRVHRVARHRKRSLASTEFAVLRTKGSSEDATYLRYVLMEREFAGRIARLANGTSGSHQRISVGDLLALPVPWPDEEHRRMAGNFITLLEQRAAQRRELQAAALKLAQAIYRRAVEGLPVGRLGDVLRLERGVSYSSAMLAESGSWLINLGNFQPTGTFRRKGLKFHSLDIDTQLQRRLTSGDLLIANTDLTHDHALLGQPLLVPPDAVSPLGTHHTFHAQFDDSGYLLPAYFAFRTVPWRQRVSQLAGGTTVASLPKEAVLEFRLPLGNSAWASAASQQIRPLVAAVTQWDVEVRRIEEHLGRFISAFVQQRVRPPLSHAGYGTAPNSQPLGLSQATRENSSVRPLTP